MPNTAVLELPFDPRQLTRELALQVFEHPEVFAQEFARLATQPKHTAQAPSVQPKAAVNG